MARIKITDAISGSPALAGVQGPTAAAESAAGAPASGLSALQGPGLAQVFERLRGAGAGTPPGQAAGLVREAVRETLDGRGLPLTAETRDALASRITQLMVDDPTTRAMLERLMGTSI